MRSAEAVVVPSSGKGNDVDTLMAKVTIGLGTAFGIITLALAKNQRLIWLKRTLCVS